MPITPLFNSRGKLKADQSKSEYLIKEPKIHWGEDSDDDDEWENLKSYNKKSEKKSDNEESSLSFDTETRDGTARTSSAESERREVLIGPDSLSRETSSEAETNVSKRSGMTGVALDTSRTSGKTEKKAKTTVGRKSKVQSALNKPGGIHKRAHDSDPSPSTQKVVKRASKPVRRPEHDNITSARAPALHNSIITSGLGPAPTANLGVSAPKPVASHRNNMPSRRMVASALSRKAQFAGRPRGRWDVNRLGLQGFSEKFWDGAWERIQKQMTEENRDKQ